MKTIHDILNYPHVTEKSTLEKEKTDGRIVVFKVDPNVTKRQIKVAVERIFEVEVEEVRTAVFLGKIKRQGRYKGRRPTWKKAYVSLKPGQRTVEFFEGV